MKVLAVLAHPDDEVIFGWPIFQHKHIKKHLICVTSGGESRVKALSEVADLLNFTWECLYIPSKHLTEHLYKIHESISRTCLEINPTMVFTHNPHGEYNHPDHLALFKHVLRNESIRNLLVTDMSISLEGSGFPRTPLKIQGKETKYYKNALCRQTRDRDLYDEARRIYRGHKAWTWGKRNIDEAGLYFIKRNNKVHRRFTLDILSSMLCEVPCSIAEIGVFKGITTKYLASCDHIKTVHAVDPWKNLEGFFDDTKLLGSIRRKDSHGDYIPARSWDELFKHVQKDLSRFSNINIVRDISKNAACQVPDELDMVFIDGDHSYKSVMQDLELWTPKIKSGGIMSGHDYTWNQDNRDKRGLVKAVLKYFEEHSEDFYPVIDPARNSVINRQDDRVWWQRKR